MIWRKIPGHTTAIALAWVLRYPGKMQAVIGTTKPQHVLFEAGKARNSHFDAQGVVPNLLGMGNDLP